MRIRLLRLALEHVRNARARISSLSLMIADGVDAVVKQDNALSFKEAQLGFDQEMEVWVLYVFWSPVIGRE